MMERMTEASPRFMARLAGAFYSLNVVTSLFAFSGSGTHWMAAASGHIATACYIAVTVLFYGLFKPVSRSLSLAAAFFGLVACAIGSLNPLHLVPFHIDSLVFFGCYCFLIGCLILRSAFLPRILGALMAIAGLGWLTFLSPQLAHSVSPYPYIAGGIGEISLTLWLLVMGVNAARWKEQAGAAAAPIRA
jgi:Domain of unknown function (DUF4386)